MTAAVSARDDVPSAERLLLTIPEAAAQLTISQRKLFDLSAPRGPLLAVRIGSRVMYDRRDLLAYIDGLKGPLTPSLA